MKTCTGGTLTDANNIAAVDCKLEFYLGAVTPTSGAPTTSIAACIACAAGTTTQDANKETACHACPTGVATCTATCSGATAGVCGTSTTKAFTALTCSSGYVK